MVEKNGEKRDGAERKTPAGFITKPIKKPRSVRAKVEKVFPNVIVLLQMIEKILRDFNEMKDPVAFYNQNEVLKLVTPSFWTCEPKGRMHWCAVAVKKMENLKSLILTTRAALNIRNHLQSKSSDAIFWLSLI